MDRRTFLTWIGVGTLASSIPAVIVACSQDVTKTTATKFRTVGSITELDAKNVIFDETDLARPILVFRHPKTKKIGAVDPKCTHKGCNVEFDSEQQLLVCPCHNSQFSLDGTVVKKPASKPLITYQTKQEGELILVKVS